MKKVLKMSEGDEDFNILRLKTEEYGYHYQFSRNMLYIGQSTGKFLETAIISGIEATDWSWSALFADYNMDGYLDIYISNGIPKRPNDLDFINFVFSKEIKKTIQSTTIMDKRALDLMPDGAVENKIFKGGPTLEFKDVSDVWIDNTASYSTSIAIGDLDNDGDLDIISNNINAPVSIIENIIKNKNYLKLKLNYGYKNKFAIGSKVFLYTGSKMQTRELYTARGFQASSEPIIHFGLGDITQVDSIRIVWPNGQEQVLKNIVVNQQMDVLYDKNGKSF